MSLDTPTIDWNPYEENEELMEEMEEKFPQLVELSQEAIKQNPRGIRIISGMMNVNGGYSPADDESARTGVHAESHRFSGG